MKTTTKNKNMRDKFLVLEKIEDKRYNGAHPNNINVGYKLKGWCIDEPVVGEALFLYVSKSLQTTPTAWTSKIEKVDVKNMLIETKNSIYKVTFDEDAKDITLEDLQDTINK